MEQSYVLECDSAGRPALILGNVIILERNDCLPIRVNAKLVNELGLSETIFSKKYLDVTKKVNQITCRELEILKNLAMGKTSKQIGEELFISPHTVDTHRRNLLNKLECSSVVELVRVAFMNGLV